MNHLISRISLPCLLLALIFGTSASRGQDAGSGKAAKPSITFKVPLRGAPKMRVGGGVRSVDAFDVAVSVLAPEQAGFTTTSMPTLYWYLSGEVSDSVEIAITDTTSLQTASKPVLEISIPGPVPPGVHALSIGEHGATLKEGVEYQWFVAVVRDAEQRSKDIIAGGSVVYSPASQALRDDLARRQDIVPAITYAAFGIWYDAIDDLSRRVEADPTDTESQALRAELLEQVGLREAAAYDRGGA